MSYDPASFLENAPTMFYALEEDLEFKIPVVFFHGIGGSIRDFEPIVNQIDRERYKPWFSTTPPVATWTNLRNFSIGYSSLEKSLNWVRCL